MRSNRVWTWIVMLTVFLNPYPTAAAPSPAPQQATAPSGKELYTTLKAFQLSGAAATVENLTLQRDRVQMTFNGTFYFEAPVAGNVYGAVFIGSGHFRAEPPPLDFERDNLRRLLNADAVDSDFRTAVLRFTDDTYKGLGGNMTPSSQPSPDAQKVADEFEPRLLKETGVNVSARLAISILNQEQPGFFISQFDKGKRGRFTFLMDYQERIPVASFRINGGEKGIIFAHNPAKYNDVWMAFYSLEDWKAQRVEYSDVNDLVRIGHYKMDVELREVEKKKLGLRAEMRLKSRVNGLRAVPFEINGDLSEDESERLKKALHLTAVFQDGTKPLDAVQEDWEGGITVFLPAPLKAGEDFTLVTSFEGEFMVQPSPDVECYYPRATTDWYPQHGFLNRSTYDMLFHHQKKHQVVTVGGRAGDQPDSGSEVVTEWKTEGAISLATFAAGIFFEHTDTAKVGEASVPLDLYAPKGRVKEDFVLAEMGNSLRYFSALFGPYQYHEFGAVYFPENFGQGFPTLLLLPGADTVQKHTFQFIAHETSHQWWGDMVTWRSYRDQWLSEGFADYSGLLYTGGRMNADAANDLIKLYRRDLITPAIGELGLGKGPVANIGPLILGLRLSTRATWNGYTALIYEKGALVLRMLHFLFTDPQTGNGQAFFDMMSDFVKQHRNGWATTEDFIRVANAHFAGTPIAKKYGMKDLNWFFKEWVYEAYLPTYRLEYQSEAQADGSVVLRGKLYQDDAPKDFVMPVPLVLHFGKDKIANGTLMAYGPEQPIAIRLPSQPSGVELDPHLWVLSAKTSESKLK